MRATLRGPGLLVLVGAISAAATARATTVCLLPIAGPGLDKEQLDSVESTISAGVSANESDGGEWSPAEPLVLKRSCGSPPARDCVKRLTSGGDVVIFATAKLQDAATATAVVNLVSYGSDGTPLAKIHFRLDLVAPDSAAATRAIAALEANWRTSKTTKAPGVPPASDVPRTGLVEKPAPAGPQAALAEKPAPAEAVARAEPSAATAAASPTKWKRTAGPVLVAAAAVLVAGGVVAGVFDKSASQSLSEKAASNALLPSDAGGFSEVRALNIVADSLFALGAAAGGFGVYFWVTAPAGAPSREEKAQDRSAGFGLKRAF